MSTLFENLLETLGEAISNYKVENLPMTTEEFNFVKKQKKDYAFYVKGIEKPDFTDQFDDEEYEQSNLYVTPQEVERFFTRTGMTKTHLLRYIDISNPTLNRFMNYEKIKEEALSRFTESFRNFKYAYDEKVKRKAS